VKKYQTGTWGDLIRVVEVERETDTSVWINGCCIRKRTGYVSYFDTFLEAKQHLLNIANRSVVSTRLSLIRAKDHYAKVKGLKE
jgi:hypothetical protein